VTRRDSVRKGNEFWPSPKQTYFQTYAAKFRLLQVIVIMDELICEQDFV